ncbi:DNA-directed RNA polymerase subunit delta [Mesoplasma seiffertii]|uniref:DNA-directed RNA polymerase subunit delta n=1 Tax=Mesoplasma seiffertii TaxID=28224 RepID=UPI0006866A67|nr:DNA-directed RNA polymerase subunit delta [Mesoplasma seiffertii]
MKLSNIDIAYEFLKQKNDASKFDEIWNSVAEVIGAAGKNKNSVIAELYSDLVLDNRFSLTPEGTWALRENVKFEDIKKQYAYVDELGKSKKTKLSEAEEAEEDALEVDELDIEEDEEDIEEDDDFIDDDEDMD